MIQVEGLVFDYPGHRALHGISLHITPGTVTALVGPNGAGKSTLLRCIAGLDAPLAGSISVAGIDVLEHPRRVHQKLGYLSDFFGLYQQLTVQQCLTYAAASQGLPEAQARQRAHTVAQQLGLQDKLTTLASNLSRGQRQRVAIGQAIVHAPKVLLLDEPASGLDPEARALLTDVFKSLQAEGMSLVVSSHILAELDQYSTHMLALNQGRVLEHRALGHSAPATHDTVERSLRLEFVADAASVARWPQAQANVRVIEVHGNAVEIGFFGNATAQAALVRACVTAGHSLVTISPLAENLQQSYLKSLAAQRAGQQPARTPA